MKAKVKNCLNNKTGKFVCWAEYEPIVYNLMKDCYGKYVADGEERIRFHDNVKRIKYVMRRHHYFKDFDYPTCFKSTMMKHDQEYADLMEYFVRMFHKQLVQKGYKPERGDGVGVCFDSMQRCFIMYGEGNLA